MAKRERVIRRRKIGSFCFLLDSFFGGGLGHVDGLFLENHLHTFSVKSITNYPEILRLVGLGDTNLTSVRLVLLQF